LYRYALAEGAFTSLPVAGADVKSLVATDPAHFTGSDVRIRDDDMTTTSFCVAFKGAAWNSPDAVGAVYKLRIQLTHSLKAPGVNP
jgi:hypothetical protein